MRTFWPKCTKMHKMLKCAHFGQNAQNVQNVSIYLSYLYSASPQMFTSYQKCFTIFTCARPFSVSFLCEKEPPPPRSIPWQLYPHFCFSMTTWGNTQCLSIHLIAPPTTLQSGRSMVVGHVPMVHTCSLMCTNHIDMIAHTLAFLSVGKHSHHLEFHHASRGWWLFFKIYFIIFFLRLFNWNFSKTFPWSDLNQGPSTWQNAWILAKMHQHLQNAQCVHFSFSLVCMLPDRKHVEIY